MPAAVSVFDFDIDDTVMAELQCEAAVEAAEIDNWTEHSAAVIAAFTSGIPRSIYAWPRDGPATSWGVLDSHKATFRSSVQSPGSVLSVAHLPR
jgi:hypothetical protein